MICPTDESELGFCAGDVLKVLDMSDDSWFTAEMNNLRASFQVHIKLKPHE